MVAEADGSDDTEDVGAAMWTMEVGEAGTAEGLERGGVVTRIKIEIHFICQWNGFKMQLTDGIAILIQLE